jgi:uncharacterized membrane protein HdeD (DUF308 family)
MAARKKGGKFHNQNGRIFYASMAVIFITTVLFFLLYPSELKYHFFLTIGIVSFYPTYSGRRILSMKKGIKPNWGDRAALAVILVSGVVMLAYGLYLQLVKPNSLSILFFVFGVFSLIQGIGDSRTFLRKTAAGKMHWFYSHAAKMIGAYSAAITAFCVNIVPRYLPENTGTIYLVALWVAPGVLFGMYSARIIRKYKAKFAGKPAMVSATDTF